MPGPATTSAAKKATFIKQGHTTDGRHGSDPKVKGVSVGGVREINPKG